MRSGMVLIALLVCSSTTIARDELPICSASDRDRYFSEIREILYENWVVPYENRSIACTVLIKQNFRGEVSYVGIANCSDDPKIHKSVIDAAYLASPIPLPKNPACFRRDVIVRIASRSQSAD
ncbi:MAG: cell envelope integrity protein TolA [Gammaproteobacteria bacterium]|nr:cell envelope integrity protein TolA [Gammaproteobacteria bacterium]MDH3433017.1 cell envelope integrity protein TolA [Gammaproteobacteria bacterium]